MNLRLPSLLLSLLLSVVMALALAAAALPGCAGSDGAFSTGCSDDDDCTEGLFCTKGGLAPGVCTIGCAGAPDICSSRFGEHARCAGDVCVRECSGGCPERTSCNHSERPNVCRGR
jgi:hypothetical protein